VKQDKAMPEVLTTQQAARILGLSVSSVQKMVINGELNAWVTPGGHRRILRTAVEKLTGSRSQAPAAARKMPNNQMRVLLVEDDPIQARAIELIVKKCTYPIELTIATDASMALIQLERQRPDLVITDLLMQPFDGFHLIKALELDPAYFPIDVIVVSAMEHAQAQSLGHLPDWVTYYRKPVPSARLTGYLDAMQTRIIKRQDSAAIAHSPK